MPTPPKVKGVVDVVILLDVSGSMQECIDAVKTNISSFITDLGKADANGTALIKDWRIKVCGYRDHEVDGESWFVDNPFVRDAASVQAQLDDPRMNASGGGDEPESLLDALFLLGQAETAGAQDFESPQKWRPSWAAKRIIAFFTDATYKTPMTLPEASGGTVLDLIHLLQNKKIKICGFIPEWEGYHDLFAMDGSEAHRVATISETPELADLGKPGDAGMAAMKAAVSALSALSRDSEGFGKLMRQLGKTLTVEAQIEVI